MIPVYKIGDYVYFVAARQRECKTCSCLILDLKFWVCQAQITSIVQSSEGHWPYKKTCSCPDDKCFCIRTQDRKAEPKITTHTSYSLFLEEQDSRTLYDIPESTIYPTEEDASDALINNTTSVMVPEFLKGQVV